MRCCTRRYPGVLRIVRGIFKPRLCEGTQRTNKQTNQRGDSDSVCTRTHRFELLHAWVPDVITHAEGVSSHTRVNRAGAYFNRGYDV